MSRAITAVVGAGKEQSGKVISVKERVDSENSRTTQQKAGFMSKTIFKIRFGMTLKEARAWQPVIGQWTECPNLKLQSDRWITRRRTKSFCIQSAIPNEVFARLWWARYRLPWTDKREESNDGLTKQEYFGSSIKVNGKPAVLEICKWIQKGGYDVDDWYRMFYMVKMKSKKARRKVCVGRSK
jgi:hypothetical protein